MESFLPTPTPERTLAKTPSGKVRLTERERELFTFCLFVVVVVKDRGVLWASSLVLACPIRFPTIRVANGSSEGHACPLESKEGRRSPLFLAAPPIPPTCQAESFGADTPGPGSSQTPSKHPNRPLAPHGPKLGLESPLLRGSHLARINYEQFFSPSPLSYLMWLRVPSQAITLRK